MTKYNLALTPLSKGHEVLKYASQISHLAYQYVLGNDSLPHVTLYQFEANENEIENICHCLTKEWKENPIQLTFEELSCVSHDGCIVWIALMPNKRQELHRLARIDCSTS